MCSGQRLHCVPDQEAGEHEGWADVLNLRMCFIAPEVPGRLRSHWMPLPAQLVPTWMLRGRRMEAAPICQGRPPSTGGSCLSLVFMWSVAMTHSPVCASAGAAKPQLGPL